MKALAFLANPGTMKGVGGSLAALGAGLDFPGHKRSWAKMATFPDFTAVAWVATLALAAAFIGCGGGTTSEDAAIESSQFKTLSLGYLEFLSANQGQVPKTLEAFKEYIEDGIGDRLKQQNLTVEEIFVSPRDGKPFVFICQNNLTQQNRKIVGYEQEGVGGRRYVSDRSGAVMEMSEEEFQRLTSEAE